MKYQDVVTRKWASAAITVFLSIGVLTFSAGRVRGADSGSTTGATVQTGLSGATWNSCATLTWKIRRPHLSRRTVAQVREAVHQLNAATGLNFAYGGHATRAELAHPADGTLIIGFSATLARKNFGGLTTLKSVPIADTGASRIVSARVMINRSLLSGTMAQYLSPVLLHELGHSVGLTHVGDPTDIMYPVAVKGARYDSAALEKLTAVGAAGACTRN